MKFSLLLSLLTGLSLIGSPAIAPKEAFRRFKRPVTIWVPPYAVAKSKKQLDTSGAKDAITYLDLQFWQPTKAGDTVLVNEPEVTSDAIKGLRDWAHKQGIRAMLCVFNGEVDWDWPLAKAAFADHRSAFVKSLITEMERFDLDGIDIDLEGPAQYEGDKPAFLSFMSALAKEVHARKKQVTVDSFCYVWNAPNQNWWPELLPVVDALTSMGYTDTGSSAPEWRSYTAQEKAAGANAAKLQLGVASDRDKWQGATAIDHLQWIKKDGGAGVAIWDAQLNAKSWKSPDLWRILSDISAIK